MSGRIRSLKPEWLDDERLVLASLEARVLSIALILLADDFGNGRASIPLLTGRVFPGKSNESTAKALGELSGWFVELYERDGQSYFHVKNWNKHQRVDKPGKPRVPAMLSGTLEIPGIFPEDPATDLEHRNIGKEHRNTTELAIKNVFDFWKTTMKHPNARLDKSRIKRIKQQLDAGFSVDDLCAAIKGATKDDWYMGRDPKSKKKYDQIDNILLNADRIEAFIALSGQKRDATGKAFTQDPVHAMKIKAKTEADFEKHKQKKLEELHKNTGTAKIFDPDSFKAAIAGFVQ